MVLKYFLVVLAWAHEVEVVVLSCSDKELRGLGLHLLLERVSGLVVEEAVAVSGPSDALH